ncbi:MAG: endonuclease/exonuclease/phosphatase family protein [Verrucomicrobia bacterium]|nr:endonuclease/exonuclease/phosphatase family protein [Verrucomicrobiota bacterium]
MRRRRIQCIATLGALAAAVLAASPPPNPPTPQTPESAPARAFTVATYNILHRNRDLPGLAAALRDTEADLIALQETNPASEAFLRRELAAAYPHMLFRGGAGGSDGLGFVSKVALRPLTFVEPLPGWRGAWIVDALWRDTPVRVANVHLATPQVGRPESLSALMAAFEKAEALHAREIARIHSRLSNATPALVLGDFNSFSFFQAPTFLARRGWVDSFASVTPNADQHGTWEYRRGGGRWRFRIDYIFHTPDLRTVHSRIPHSPASDHQPVVSRLAVPSGPVSISHP